LKDELNGNEVAIAKNIENIDNWEKRRCAQNKIFINTIADNKYTVDLCEVLE